MNLFNDLNRTFLWQNLLIINLGNILKNWRNLRLSKLLRPVKHTIANTVIKFRHSLFRPFIQNFEYFVYFSMIQNNILGGF